MKKTDHTRRFRSIRNTAGAVLLSCIACTSVAQDKSFSHNIFGLLKTGFETSTETGEFRFNVNNARLGLVGLKGTSEQNFKYQIQAELNAEGKINILDTYVAFTSGAFEVSLGQQQYRFGTEANRGPRFNYFVNSSFFGNYIGSYYHIAQESTQNRVGNIGARDIGIIVKYNNHSKIPVNILAGLLNGSGINNPVWRKNVNFVARIWLDDNTILGGFGTAVNYYVGKTPFNDKITMGSAELRYIHNRWIIEGEYGCRWLTQDAKTNRLDLAVLHAIYRQPVNGWGPIKFLAPMARWDWGNNITLIDSNSDFFKFDAQRLTGGVTIGFAEKLLQCEVRLNYEHYFFGNKPQQIANNPTFQNKFIAEFFLVF